MEPPVSLPRLRGASSAETATAEPPDEPPGARSVSHGLWTGPKALFSLVVPIANSSRFVFPMETAPISSSFWTDVAVNGGM